MQIQETEAQQRRQINTKGDRHTKKGDKRRSETPEETPEETCRKPACLSCRRDERQPQIDRESRTKGDR